MGLSPNESLLRLLESVSPIDRPQYAVALHGLERVFGGQVRAFYLGGFEGTGDGVIAGTGDGVIARVGDDLFFVSYESGEGLRVASLASLEGGILVETFKDVAPHHATSLVGSMRYSLRYTHKGHALTMTDLEDWAFAEVEPIRDLLRGWAMA